MSLPIENCGCWLVQLHGPSLSMINKDAARYYSNHTYSNYNDFWQVLEFLSNFRSEKARLLTSIPRFSFGSIFHTKFICPGASLIWHVLWTLGRPNKYTWSTLHHQLFCFLHQECHKHNFYIISAHPSCDLYPTFYYAGYDRVLYFVGDRIK